MGPGWKPRRTVFSQRGSYGKNTKIQRLHGDGGLHYDSTPMLYTANFHAYKNGKFQMKTNDIFLIFAQNIYCGYKFEPRHLDRSNEYPQSMFSSKNKNQRTNGPVNAYLICRPSKKQSIQNMENIW